jgi:glycosyltransferase involved in cell wall biosynthesis
LTSTPTRIAYCEGNIDGTIGGSYYSLLFLLSFLDRAQFEPVVVFRAEHELMPEFRALGVQVEIIPITRPLQWAGLEGVAKRVGLRALVVTVRRATNLFRGLVWEAVRLASWMRRERIRLVHLNNSVTRNHSWMLAARLARLPCMTHERGINARYSRISRTLGARLGAIICISEAVRDRLRECGVGRDNLELIYNGIDALAYAQAVSERDMRAELGIDRSELVLCMVGNIRRWKGQHVLVEALGHLGEAGLRPRCVFVGAASAEDAPYDEELRRLVAEHALPGQVIFTGYVRNVPDLMSMADVVVHASVDPEPFGRVLIEAMSLGKPVVGSAGGAVPEILDAPRSGLTFTPGDASALAEALRDLIEDAGRRADLGARAEERVRAQFDIRSNVAQTQRLYTRLLGDR